MLILACYHITTFYTLISQTQSQYICQEPNTSSLSYRREEAVRFLKNVTSNALRPLVKATATWVLWQQHNRKQTCGEFYKHTNAEFWLYIKVNPEDTAQIQKVLLLQCKLHQLSTFHKASACTKRMCPRTPLKQRHVLIPWSNRAWH